jgi:hypothetical protein
MDRTEHEVIALTLLSAAICGVAFAFDDIVATAVFAVMTCTIALIAVELRRQS